MKEINICSLKELKYLLREGKIDVNSSYALISSSYPLDMPELSHMRYSFECYDDIDFDSLGRVFSVEAANRFSKAIKENDNIQHFWCVCDGGVSRSAAVAASILRFWGRCQDEIDLIWNDSRKAPNVWVYRIMCNSLGVPVGDANLDLLIYTNRSAIRTAMRRK